MYKKGSNKYIPNQYSKINPSKYLQDIRTFSIDKFLGVDFTKGEYITDNRRSPDAVNTIWSNNPYSFSNRRGKLRLTTGTPNANDVVYGIHYIETTHDVLVHIGTYLKKYTLQSNGTLSGAGNNVFSTMNSAPSTSFYFEGNLYILDGKQYLIYDGATCERVSSNAYIPTTIKSGSAYEQVNLLTRKRINMFCPTSSYSEAVYSITTGQSGAEFILKFQETEGVDADLPSSRFKSIDSIIIDGKYYITKYSVDTTDTNAKITLDTTGYDNKSMKIKVSTWNNKFTLDTKKKLNASVYTYSISSSTWTQLQTGYSFSTEDGINNVVLTLDSAPKSSSENEGIDTIKVLFTANDQKHYNGYSNAGATQNDYVFFDIQRNHTISSDSSCTLYGILSGDFSLLTITNIEHLESGQVKVSFNRPALSSYSGYQLRYDYVINDGNEIDKCTICGIYGGENDMRVFLSGNPDSPNKDWYCGLYDPTYFPDLGYTYIGTQESAIMGYIKQYDTQIVIKQSSQNDTSAWLRTYEVDSDGNPKFPLEQGSVGTGAISNKTFGYLNTNPLFLSSEGLMKVAGTNVDYQRLIQCVSEKINSKLLQESNLDKAIGIEYKDKYYLFINNHVYVCDARMQYEDALGIAQYEWSYWEGIGATAVAKCGEYLLFGYEGIIYRLKIEGDTNEFQDDDYLTTSNTNLFNEINETNAFEQLVIGNKEGIYKWTGVNSTIRTLKEDISLYVNNFYKITSYDYYIAYTTDDIDPTEDGYFLWEGYTGETISGVTLTNGKFYEISTQLISQIYPEWVITSEDKLIEVTNVLNTWQSHEIKAYWVTPKFTLNSIASKKRFRDLYILFNKAVSVKCQITATIDSDYGVDFGLIERLNMSEYDTAVYKEKINIESLDNISLKLEKVIGGATQNASFGVEMLQITYQYKND